jgi:glycosyltransferase involved in cell wall biosynthesis
MEKKVVQLQVRSTSSGDFGKRLHEVFIKEGIDSSIISLYSDSPNSDAQLKLGRKADWTAKLDYKANEYLMRHAKKEYGLFSYPLWGTDVTQLPQVKTADVIYLHWIHHGFLSLKNMEQLAKLGKPIVIILHDMWFLTGGCHYAFECDKYTVKCHNCQVFSGSKEKDLAFYGFEKKQKFLAQFDNIFFVSPSKWMYDCALQSELTKNKPIYHIPNVLDRKLYKKFDKKVARDILNIGQEERVILFGAAAVDSPYKGWSYLNAAIHLFHQQTHDEHTSILIFGGGNDAGIASTIPFPTRFMGRLKDEYTLALLYNAADVFIAPSLADNLPYTIFESLACGTPVVAFNTGGIPDLIQHKINGYLANYKDAEDIARGIAFCFNHQLEAQPPALLDNILSIHKHFQLWDDAKS